MAKAKTTPSPKKGKATGQAKAAATPDPPPLRRSPRKAVTSTKKAEAQETAKVSKKASPAKKTSVAKKLANVLKKPALARKATKTAAEAAPATKKTASPAPKKAAARAKSPAPKKSASPAAKKTAPKASPKKTAQKASPKKAASKSPAKSTTASPRPRGRPRKSESPAHPATASPRPRGRPPKNAAASKVTQAKASPKKAAAQKQPSRGRYDIFKAHLLDIANGSSGSEDEVPKAQVSPKKTPAQKRSKRELEDEPLGLHSDHDSASSPDEELDDELLQPAKAASPVKAASNRARSKSPAKARNNSAPSRRESPAAAKSASRRGSAEKERGPVSPSKSPTKAAPPSSKNSAAGSKSRSQSPAKAAQATSPRKASGAEVRGRFKSPVKTCGGVKGRRIRGASTRLRSQSPAKVTKPASPRKIGGAVGRTRSKSPAKSDRNTSRSRNFGGGLDLSGFPSNQDYIPFDSDSWEEPPPIGQVIHRIEVDPVTGEECDVETVCDEGRNANNVQLNPDGSVARTMQISGGFQAFHTRRVLRKPGNNGQSARRRSKSPARKALQNPTKSPARKASTSNATKKIAASPTKAAAKRPTKAAPARSPTKAASRRKSPDRRWDNKFNANDDYGKTLRKLEMKAYTAKKDGKVFRKVSPAVDDDDAARAKQQGVDRAQEEFSARTLADNREQRVREGYDDRVVDLTGDDDSDEGGNKTRGKKSPTRQIKPASPQRKTSSSLQRQAPWSPQQNKSPARRPSRQSADDEEEKFTPLPQGQPSAPDRGAVHSVTNPELIAGTKKKNPFFETMPGPEHWHRNQPAYFMFGETPYMQQEISRQINSDLKKGAGGSDKEPEKPRNSSIGGIIPGLMPSFGKSKERSGSAEQPTQRKSPFALPHVDDEKVEAMLRELGRIGGQKRRASGIVSPARSPRRPRRMSVGNGSRSRSRSPPAYQMSGALSLM